MATLHVKDDTYHRLARLAAARNTTVEQFIEPVLDQLAETPPAGQDRAGAAERWRAFEEWMQLVRKRADRYPEGFVLDDSRETIYEGRGE